MAKPYSVGMAINDNSAFCIIGPLILIGGLIIVIIFVLLVKLIMDYLKKHYNDIDSFDKTLEEKNNQRLLRSVDKRNCNFCGKLLTPYIDNFFCSTCGGIYCQDHRMHDSHLGEYVRESSKIKLSIVGNCSKCKQELNTLSKMVCAKCLKSFCLEHVAPNTHKCKPFKSKKWDFPGDEYPDGTRVYTTNRLKDPDIPLVKRK